LLTAGVLTFNSRAVAEKLPQRASRLKNAISEGAESGVLIVSFKLTTG
jgi:hypothetical protein